MRNTKLIQVLRTFSNMEMKHLGLMTNSPYFNRKKEVSELFAIIRSHHPKFEIKSLERKTVYAKLFPKRQYDDQRFRDLMKSMSKLTEEIMTRSKRTDVDENSVNLVLSYINRGLLDSAMRCCNKNLQKMEAGQEKNSDYYWTKGSLLNLRNFILYRLSNGFSVEATRPAGPMGVINAKMTSFIMVAQDVSQTLVSIRSIFGIEFNDSMFKNLLIPFTGAAKELSIKAKFNIAIMRMNLESSDSSFFEVKNLLVNSTENIPESQLRTGLINLQNYCKRRTDEGNMGFTEERFALYEWEIENGFALSKVDGLMDCQHLMSSIATALVINKVKWATQYLERFKDSISGDNKADVIQFCWVMIAFKEGKFRESRKILSTINYGTFDQKLLMRMVELKINYELKDFEAVMLKIDSTRQYITNAEFIPEYKKPNRLNFIKFLLKLVLAHDPNSKSDVKKIKVEVLEYDQLENKTWLIQKCDEFEAK